MTRGLLLASLCWLLAYYPLRILSVACEASDESFKNALRVGNWVCARFIAESSVMPHDLLHRVFEAEHRGILNELAAIKAAVDRKQVQNVVYLSPAFQWAQSPEEVFLSVKFSHKLDAPATLNVQHNLTLSSDRVLLEGSNGVKWFRLEVELLGEIVAEASGWQSSSNGRITITLRKHKAAKWARLLKDNAKKPSNMHFWLDKQEPYNAALDALLLAEQTTTATTTEQTKKAASGSSPTDDNVRTAETLSTVSEGVAHVPVSKPAAAAATSAAGESFEARLRRTREEELRQELEALETEKTLRLAEVSRRTLAERSGIEKDIADRRAELQLRAKTARQEQAGEEANTREL